MSALHSHVCLFVSVLVLVLVNSAVCDSVTTKKDNDVQRFLHSVNEAYLKINRLSAYIAWESSIRPSEALLQQSVKLGTVRTTWRNRMCSKATELQPEDMTRDERRQIYLLCRGPKYTPYQASVLTKLLDKLQAIYSISQVCIPRNYSLDNLYEQTILRNPDAERRMSQQKLLAFDLSSIFDEFIGVLLTPLETGSNQISTRMPDNTYDEYICLDGEPDLERLMTGRNWNLIGADNFSTSAKETLLRWAWEAWRGAVGPPIRVVFPEVVNMLNIGAQNNGYSDMGKVWREELEISDLKEICYELLNDVMPFYKLLHAFVRNAIAQHYNLRITRHIPAHLLGNLWSQSWESLENILIGNRVDLDQSIKNNEWSTLDMVKRAEDFYTSMGLKKMTDEFWKYSSFKNSDNCTKCHGTAANMFRTDDYRILLRADGTMEDFYVIHHEMGHIQYYMAYKDQPALLQDGTNSAFQESIGDAIMLGVMTPQHLNRLGLINDTELFEKNAARRHPFTRVTTLPELSFDLSLLMRQALSKIPPIPFGFILDTYRWSLFEDQLNNSNYNAHFWDLTREFQGVREPGYRSEHYFDIAAKFHVPDNTPYIRYFLASFLQAQIFRGLCSATVFGRPTEDKLPMPLHRCDIYGSKKAGKKLRELMSLGATVHWSEALYIVSKTRRLSAAPLLEYFDPIIKWLEKYIDENNIPVDW